MSRSRDTAQRRAIRQVFEQEDRPLSAAEAHRIAQEICPGLGIATAYRVVNRMVGEGWLSQVVVPGGTTFYELASKAPHHYFLCEACGRLFNTACAPKNVAALSPEGFRVARHDVFLYGRCRYCSYETPHGPAADGV